MTKHIVVFSSSKERIEEPIHRLGRDLYSFTKANNDLVKNIQIFISLHDLDQILIQLYEYLCVIQGYVCSVIQTLNQQIQYFIEKFQLCKQSEIQLYSTNLNEVSKYLSISKKNIDEIK
ncbi:unnamed protein product [Rotaria sp. Silwood1]|nr:unnamed protein product [Rotaria sp. Silwood1]CAF1635567.1 unnamed protein product [Rotaria sp. Silwood1]